MPQEDEVNPIFKALCSFLCNEDGHKTIKAIAEFGKSGKVEELRKKVVESLKDGIECFETTQAVLNVVSGPEMSLLVEKAKKYDRIRQEVRAYYQLHDEQDRIILVNFIKNIIEE